MKIDGDWLHHAGTRAVLATLGTDTRRVLFVGGCVRNALMGLPVGDIDLATDTSPDVVLDLCVKAGLKVVPTGIEHGTVTVIAGGRSHEVTTFRRDVATDGRRAQVVFGTDLAVDAARRDFTMNALYADPDGTVTDPLGGLPDVLARRVRFVGDPVARITEDYLRILRFFRFHAVYGDPAGGIDPDGLAACAANSAGIETLSRERLGQEMRKLLAARDPGPAVAAMQAAGVLAQILPGADARALPVLVHLEGDLPTRWLRRLALLGGQDVPERLRLSRTETSALATIRAAISAGQGALELGHRHGIATGTDVILCRAAMLGTDLPDHWQDELARGAGARFPVSAADLTPGLDGAALGARLRVLKDRWIKSDFTLSRDDLMG